MNPELRAFVAEIVRSTLRQESPAMIELTIQHMETFVPRKLKALQGTQRMTGRYVSHLISKEVRQFSTRKENTLQVLLL